MPQTVLHPLAPLITAESHTLILGTMPSPRSRAETFYYAHPQNRFWPVIAALYGEDDAKAIRKSHENPLLKKVYAEYLGEPGGHKAHHILHTSYVAREKLY